MKPNIAHGGIDLNHLNLTNMDQSKTINLTQKRITEINNELRRQRAARDAEQSFIEMLEREISDLLKTDTSVFNYTQTLNYTDSITTKKRQIKSALKRITRHETIINTLEFSLKYQ